jgi:hypothetical protein
VSDGVTVAQGPLEAFVMVRIHVGQPFFTRESDQTELFRTDSAQNSTESESESVRFPKIIRHRKSEATIYGESKRYPFYRVVCRADGERRMKSIASYSEARHFADKKVHGLAEGYKIPALAKEFVFYKNALIALAAITISFALYPANAQLHQLGDGDPGLKVIYRTTNQFVIYLDEAWTVGPGLIGGYDKRHIDVLFDRNYGLKQMIQTRSWEGIPQQLYPFNDHEAFTCEGISLDPDSESLSNWFHRTQVFSLNGDSVSVSDDVYILARQQYGLTSSQLFLGKFETNIFYWERSDPTKVFYHVTSEEAATNYFELPKGIIDLFGVTKSAKKDVGFVVLKKSTGFFHYSPNEFTFVEFYFKNSKRVKGK